MNTDQVRQLDFSTVHINSAILWGVFGFTFVVCAVITTILSYHWHAYGMKNPKVIFAQTIYYPVVTLLLMGEIYFILKL